MNGFTHFIGVVLSIIGTNLLIKQSLSSYNPAHFFSLLTFGLGLILLYTTSTLYHWLKISNEVTKKLRKADHIMIFINIALQGTMGTAVLILVWSVGFAGIIVKIFWMNAPRWLSTIIYLIMGWLAVIVIVPLVRILPIAALLWMLAGGLFFTIGAVIYARKKPDPYPGILGFHEIFHLFVLLGSFSHFIMIYKYITLLN